MGTNLVKQARYVDSNEKRGGCQAGLGLALECHQAPALEHVGPFEAGRCRRLSATLLLGNVRHIRILHHTTLHKFVHLHSAEEKLLVG